MTKNLNFLIIGILAFTEGAARACPAYIDANVLKPLNIKARQDLRAFALHVNGNSRAWTPLPIQIDELDDKGILLGSSPDKAPAPTDRVSMRVEHFGERVTSADSAPCLASQAMEIENPNQPGRYGYIVACADNAPKTPDSPVKHNPELLQVSSPHYDYVYLPNNQLMYKSLGAKDPSWNAPIPAASNAEIDLHLDIKRFLTINFSNKNVESYVGKRVSGPVGMVGNIEFFLRLLFLKIDLKLGSTAGFYGDSAHVPSIIDVPVDAFTKLNAGSGLLYQWKLDQALIDQNHPEKTMPIVKPALIKDGWESYANEGLKYCSGDSCVYQLRGSVGELPWGIDIYLRKSEVERGFYPAWVADVTQFKKEMGWKIQDADTGRVGVFFNNGGLPKGQYPMNQWIRLGRSGLLSQCPAPVRVGSILAFDKIQPKLPDLVVGEQ
jgi:hypothetical protein